jgi:hypothetical protein
MRNRRRLFGVALPFLMLALASLACDLEASMGELTSEPQTFTATGGWEYYWSAEVTPGKEYEVSIATPDRDTPPFYAVLTVSGRDCEDCRDSDSGYVTIDGLSASIIAPQSGKLRIRVYVRDMSTNCVIQLREVG